MVQTLVSFAMVSTLLLPLQWKNTPVKNYAICATVVGIAKLFCQKMFRPGHPGWIQSYANSEISVTEGARLLIWSNWFFVSEEKSSETTSRKSSQLSQPGSHEEALSCESESGKSRENQCNHRVRVAKAVKISAIMIRVRLESFIC